MSGKNHRPPKPPEPSVEIERRVLACILEKPQLIGQVDSDLSDDFLLSDHRKLWRAAVKLHGDGTQLDSALWAEESKVDLTYIAGFYDGADYLTENFRRYIAAMQKATMERRVRHLAADLVDASSDDYQRIIEQLQTLKSGTQLALCAIDIEEVQSMEITPADYIVPSLGIARGTVCLWTGEDGTGKTALAYAMACAIGTGADFLGMPCQQTTALYIDLENPAYVVQARVRQHVGEESTPFFRVWGNWVRQPPPQFGNPQLLAMCREWKPVVFVDPFRYFHFCNEDSSTEMSPVMQYCRALANCGGAVVLLHHTSKAENVSSRGRGSTAIRAGCDLAFSHSLERDTGIVTLRVEKNRHGEQRDYTIQTDFETGKFELVEAAWSQHRKAQIEYLKELISKKPGITSNQLYEAAGGKKEKLLKLLEEGAGSLWKRVPGTNRSFKYFSLTRANVGH